MSVCAQHRRNHCRSNYIVHISNKTFFPRNIFDPEVVESANVEPVDRGLTVLFNEFWQLYTPTLTTTQKKIHTVSSPRVPLYPFPVNFHPLPPGATSFWFLSPLITFACSACKWNHRLYLSLYLTSFAQHVLRFTTTLCVWVICSFSDCWVLFHCINIQEFAYPLICWWTFGWFPLFRYCK